MGMDHGINKEYLSSTFRLVLWLSFLAFLGVSSYAVAVNATLMRRLASHSILLFGDSTSAEIFQTGCEVLAARQELFLEDARTAVSYKATTRRANVESTREYKYYHWSRGGTMHWSWIGSGSARSTWIYPARIQEGRRDGLRIEFWVKIFPG